jgi:hypothetical protein
MARPTEYIELSKEEHSYLKALFSGGTGSNRHYENVIQKT